VAYSTGYYAKITIGGGLSAAALSNYTLWITAENVSANVLSNIQANARADLNDVRFSTDTAGDNLLSLYKILASPANGDFAFLVGPVNYTGSTALEIYMHWGDGTLTTDSSASTVFDSSVVSAYTPRAVGAATDLASTGNNLATAGGTIAVNQTSAPPGNIYSWDFSASASQYMSLANATTKGMGVVGTGATIRLLMKNRSTGNAGFANVGDGNAATSGHWFGAGYLTSAGNHDYVVSQRAGTGQLARSAIASSTLNAWNYFAVKFDPTTSAVGGLAWSTTASNVASGYGQTSTLSNIYVGTGDNNASLVMAGRIAFAAFDATTRSDAWLAADNRLMLGQATYVAYDADPTAHGAGASATPTTGTLALIGGAPTVFRAVSATPTTGALAIAGAAPEVFRAVAATPASGSVAITGNAPTATAVTGASATPGVGSLALIGAAPQVFRAVSTTPAVGSVAIVGAAPAVFRAVSATPATGSVSVIGAAPTVLTGAGVAKTATPTVGHVSIIGAVPMVEKYLITGRLVRSRRVRIWEIIERDDEAVMLAYLSTR
jgi:hypothetical protein